MSTYRLTNVSDEDLEAVRVFGRVERLNEGTCEVLADGDDEVGLICCCFNRNVEIYWES